VLLQSELRSWFDEALPLGCGNAAIFNLLKQEGAASHQDCPAKDA
jgi:hypothetical protein